MLEFKVVSSDNKKSFTELLEIEVWKGWKEIPESFRVTNSIVEQDITPPPITPPPSINKEHRFTEMPLMEKSVLDEKPIIKLEHHEDFYILVKRKKKKRKKEKKE